MRRKKVSPGPPCRIAKLEKIKLNHGKYGRTRKELCALNFRVSRG